MFVNSIYNEKFISNSYEQLRGPMRYQYSINIFVKFNDSFKLKTYNNSRAIYWALTKYTITNSNFDEEYQPIPTVLYNVANPSVRDNNLLRNKFICYPNDSECNEIYINQFDDLNYIGTYSYQSLINTLDSLYVDYNISLLLTDIQISCQSNNSKCVYDKSKPSIKLLANNQVEISCNVLFAQNIKFEPDVEILMNDCKDKETTIQIVDKNYLEISNLTSKNILTNILVFNLTTRCKKYFTKFDNNKLFECTLKPKENYFIKNSLKPELYIIKEYEKKTFSLNVEYGPEFVQLFVNNYNQTIISGSNRLINFSCPFISNPEATYYWKVADIKFNTNNSLVNYEYDKISNRRRLSQNEFIQSSMDYTILPNLEIGNYIFECKAKSFGLVENTSNIIKFHLNVLGNKNLFNKYIASIFLITFLILNNLR